MKVRNCKRKDFYAKQINKAIMPYAFQGAETIRPRSTIRLRLIISLLAINTVAIASSEW